MAETQHSPQETGTPAAGPAQTEPIGDDAPAAAGKGTRPGRRPAGRLKRFFARLILPDLALGVLALLRATWRIRETGREHFDQAFAAGRPPAIAFLHGRSVMLLLTIRLGGHRFISMSSKSLDGDAIARIEQRLGFQVVRGSSGRDGLQAIIEMIRRVRAQPEMGSCLAVDGSRGPRGRVQGGIISLAQRTSGLILPVTVSARPAWIFRKAWDRHMLALPFARVEVVYGVGLEVPPRLRTPEFNRLCLDLEERLVALQATADTRSGFSDSEPVRAPLPAE